MVSMKGMVISLLCFCVLYRDVESTSRRLFSGRARVHRFSTGRNYYTLSRNNRRNGLTVSRLASQQNGCQLSRVSAICTVTPTRRNSIEGRIYFVQDVNSQCEHNSWLTVKVELQGLDSSIGVVNHGLHIHQFGDLGNGCLAAGSHYNPFTKYHGDRNTYERHIGDMGNVREDNDGSIREIFTIPITSIVGENSVIGRTVVLHAGQDDLGLVNNENSRTTGNSGSRLACCVIGHSNQVPDDFED
ncbi:uncharacterized protein LOC126816074 [Patella vulgata]|uniref:uncharacterized protein LOC126816074 n=1 Tax=Patella vulgata TaxID=6465 RepID=UPI00217F3B3C|nr:uncharacterized protein LOC126816074 [Patella vulgata]